MLLTCSMVVGSSADPLRIPGSWTGYLTEAERHGSTQFMLVITEKSLQSRAVLHCLEFESGNWKFVHPALSSSVGRNGIADPGQKREGDGMTPYGVFPLGLAFGYGADCPTRMPYRQMHPDDIWVDDPGSDDYNRLVRIGETCAESFEYMRRPDDLYRQGLVVEYNTDPVIKGLGSAIFVHLWGTPFNSTAGCLSLPEQHLETVLSFLDPAKSPVIGFFRRDLHNYVTRFCVQR